MLISSIIDHGVRVNYNRNYNALNSVATKIILALETSSMSIDDITDITDMNTIPLSRFAIKLDIIFQLLNQYNQNDSELILQPRLFRLVRQIKLDCQQ